MLGSGRQQAAAPDQSPPARHGGHGLPGEGRVSHLLRGGGSEKRVPAAERSASPQDAGASCEGAAPRRDCTQ